MVLVLQYNLKLGVSNLRADSAIMRIYKMVGSHGYLLDTWKVLQLQNTGYLKNYSWRLKKRQKMHGILCASFINCAVAPELPQISAYLAFTNSLLVDAWHRAGTVMAAFFAMV
jgi:hypothetical protein